jgi:hypothetical protein
VAALTVYFQLLELRPKVEICNLTARWPALRLPKISSGQVGEAVGFGGSRISWLLSEVLSAAG